MSGRVRAKKNSVSAMVIATFISNTRLPGGDPNHVHPQEKLCDGDCRKEGNYSLILECQRIQAVEGMNGCIRIPNLGETCRMIRVTCAKRVHKKNDKSSRNPALSHLACP